MSGKKRILILKGSQWARGGKNGPSSLYNEEGASCCLGVDALSRGISADILEGCSMPSDVDSDSAASEYLNDWLTEDGEYDSAEAAACADLNDTKDGTRSSYLSDEVVVRDDFHRVDLLRPYFRTRGIVLRFRPDL